MKISKNLWLVITLDLVQVINEYETSFNLCRSARYQIPVTCQSTFKILFFGKYSEVP